MQINRIQDGPLGQSSKRTLSMASQAPSPQYICSVCESPLIATKRHCPTCKNDAGVPNVRACRTDENLKALVARFETAKSLSTTNGVTKEFLDFEDLLKKESNVIISMSARMARNLFEDPKLVYLNYETLVKASVRNPANLENDQHRCAVGAILFGNYAKKIVYGTLSLTENGLPTYGNVHCQLRHVAIDKRTSFLETNSFKFIQEHGILPGKSLPVGYMACWDDRHRLVLAKLARRLSTGQTKSDWQEMLIQTDGQNRQNDDFVEAHIYESFDQNAIESFKVNPDKKLNRHDKLDLDILISKFGGNAK